MKPFHFSLQSLQVLRQQAESASQQKYAAALTACEDAVALVKAASAQLTTCWTGLHDMMSAGIQGADILRVRSWYHVLELELKERSVALQKARAAVDDAWQQMIQATREREALDRYRDKRKRAHDVAMQREEQKTLDELAVQLIDTSSPLRFSRQPVIH